MISCFLSRRWRVFNFGAALLGFLFFNLVCQPAAAVLRDGGVDPANLGQGGWIYVMSNATNHMSPNNISSVTNQNSLMKFLKSQGLSYVIVKAGTSNKLFSVTGGNVAIGSPSAAFNTALVNAAHTNGLKIFGSNRSWGADIPGEIAVADYVFQQGADGFIYDAESEWEASGSRPWITNAPVQAWQLCSTVRSNWPTKFIAHNPYDTVYAHFSFPYKEFGYWCDATMPQVYHHSASSNSAIAAIHWTDWNYTKLHEYFTTNPPSVIDGQTIYWTNSIKPLTLMRDVYNGGAGTPVHPDSDVRNFLDYMVADPNCVTVGGYNGSDYFRSELHSTGQWANIKAATIGNFPGVVNNIVIDDANATRVGSWTMVKTMDANASKVIFSGEVAGDTNSFGTNYWKKAQGGGSAYMQFRPNIITPGYYNVYQWHPTRADASTNVPFVINYNGGSTTIYANQQTNAANWTLLGRFDFAAGTNGTIQVFDNFSDPASVAMVDGLKLVFAPLAIPTPPSGLTGTGISGTDIGLTWSDNSTNEAGFILARGSASGGPYTNIVTVNANIISYSDTNLSPNTTYYYVVRALNSLGESADSAQGNGMTLGIPTISMQPSSRTNDPGTTAVFTVGAIGANPLAYQWRKNGFNLNNGGNISGATSTTLTVISVTALDAGNYTVQVTNAFGNVTSIVATLTVNLLPTPPSITAEPQGLTIVAGQNAAFDVDVDGSEPLSYQWKFNGGNIAGATGSSYTLLNAQSTDAGSYSVAVTNSAGSALSDSATLTINYSLSTTATSGGTVSKNPNLTSYTFNDVVTVTAAPDAGFNFTGWSGDASGTDNPLQITMTANKIVTANFAAPSTDIILDNLDPGVTFTGDWQTGSGLNKYNSDYRFASTTLGGNSNVVYRPYISTPGNYDIYIWYPQGSNRATNAPWTIQYDGGSTNILVNQTIGGGAWFLIASSKPFALGTGGYVRLSNAAETSKVVLADAVRFIYAGPILTPPEITSEPISQTNSAGVSVTFSVSANGSEPLTFQWKKGVNNLVDGGNVSGATTASLTLSGISQTDAAGYSVIVSNGAGTDTSLTATLTVIDPPAITAQPSSLSIGAGSNAVFNVTASGANLSYGWRKNNSPLSNGGNVMGAISASLTLSQVSVSDEADYTVVIQNSAGSITSAPPAVLNVFEAPAILIDPVSRTNDAGTTATFTVSATGTGPLNFQWKKNNLALTDGGNIAGATSPTLTLDDVLSFDAADYTVLVGNGAGSILSAAATLTVIDPVITSQPTSLFRGPGTIATFTVVAHGTLLTYQWKKDNADLADVGGLSGTTSTTLTIASVQASDAGNYSVTVRNDDGDTVTSSNAALSLQGDGLFKPTISISLPSKTPAPTIKIAGKAKDTAPGTVAQVWYRLSPETNFSLATLSSASGQTNWTSPDVNLTPGTNTAYAYAIDSGGNYSTTNFKTFFYDLTNLLTVNIMGGGEVKNSAGLPVTNGQKIPLLVGRPSSLTAFIRSGTAATNFVFSNWFGTITSTNPALKFVMQTNMMLTAQFISNPFVPVAGKYNGLFYETNGVSHRTAGFITLTLSPRSTYSGKIFLDGNVLSLSGGRFNLSGQSSKTLLRAAKFGKSDLALELNLDWDTGSQKIFGTVGDGTWSSLIEADRATFSLTNLATNFVGRYTMLIPRTNYPAESPGGFGYGLITNSLLGKIVLSGRSGDDRAFSQSVPISKDGRWPFYVPLYKNTNLFTNGITFQLATNKADTRGSLLGWISFTRPTNGPAGTVHWIKTGVPATNNMNTNYFYAGGFSNSLEIISSPFNTPPIGTRILQMTGGTLSAYDGNLAATTWWNAFLAENNAVSVGYIGTNRVTMTLNSKTGLMKGTFPHPNKGNSNVTFYGAVMQDQNYAAGEFAGKTEAGSTTNQTGSVRFE